MPLDIGAKLFHLLRVSGESARFLNSLQAGRQAATSVAEATRRHAVGGAVCTRVSVCLELFVVDPAQGKRRPFFSSPSQDERRGECARRR